MASIIFPLNWSILLPFIVSLLDNWNASLGLLAGGLLGAAVGGLGSGLTGLSIGFSAYEVSSSMSKKVNFLQSLNFNRDSKLTADFWTLTSNTMNLH